MAKKFVSNPDHIRVAPMYRPKTKVKLSELKEGKETELFDPTKKAAPPANAHLVYQGGPLIKNVEVYTIYWGNNWAKTASYKTLAKQINEYFKAILVSPLMDQLSEYSTAAFPIGRGKLVGTQTITADAPVGSISDAKIKVQIKKWIDSKVIPSNNPNTLYFVYMDAHVKVMMGGGSSCTVFCGYHNDIGSSIFYAVMPYPGCTGCLGGLSTFEAMTATSSHELCEAVTDPIPGTGWYDMHNGEIGDICAWEYKTVAGYKVQKEWSNAKKKCV